MRSILLFGFLLILTACSRPEAYNENYLQAADEAVSPNRNFLYASNASLLGRIGMTLTPICPKTCINTVTSFYNKYHTCSNCEDFEKDPQRWGFRKTNHPKVGDIVIQHDAETGRAFHACIIVDIKDGKYYVNHAIRNKYFKNVQMKYVNHLTFYEFVPETEIQDTTTCTCLDRDTTVYITETDSLKIYKTAFGRIGLCLEPAKENGRIFIAAAAYTKSYDWTKFGHSLIAGPHINGKFYDGYQEDANSGAFYYINSLKKWGFVHQGFEQELKDVAALKETTAIQVDKASDIIGFSQVMLVYNGSLCSIHHNANPSKLRLRRAICELNGELVIIDSKERMTIPGFAKCLRAAGVVHGLYMDMGSMRHSAYRECRSGEWTEIHPRNSKTRYCTNYLVFYSAE